MGEHKIKIENVKKMINESYEEILEENSKTILPTEEHNNVFYSMVEKIIEYVKEDCELLHGSFPLESSLEIIGLSHVMQSLKTNKRINFKIYCFDLSKIEIIYIGPKNNIIKEEFDINNEKKIQEWSQIVLKIEVE